MSIETYNKENATSKSYVKKEDCTMKIEKFVQYLHDFIPTITEEFNSLEEKSKIKPNKAFDDKMAGLAAIFNAEKDLYYWYVTNKKRQA